MSYSSIKETRIKKINFIANNERNDSLCQHFGCNMYKIIK